MATTPFPIAMPEDLLEDIRAAARDTGLSQADVVRQSVKAGLPKVRAQFQADRKLKPFSKEEARQAFAPNRDWDKLEEHMASLPQPLPEPD
jgi:hypothetical protein